MAKIRLLQGAGPASAVINTHNLAVEVTEVDDTFKLLTDTGETLTVVMVDNGFEIQYTAGTGNTAYDSGVISMANGIVTRKTPSNLWP